jgi:hypothetical protein
MFKNAFNYHLKHSFWQTIGFYLLHLLVSLPFALAFSIVPVVVWGLYWGCDTDEFIKIAIASTHAICGLMSVLFSYFAMQGKGLTQHKNQWVAAAIFGVLAGAFAYPVVPMHATYLAFKNAEKPQKTKI